MSSSQRLCSRSLRARARWAVLELGSSVTAASVELGRLGVGSQAILGDLRHLEEQLRRTGRIAEHREFGLIQRQQVFPATRLIVDAPSVVSAGT